MAEVIDHLRAVPLFQGLSDRGLASVADLSEQLMDILWPGLAATDTRPAQQMPAQQTDKPPPLSPE